MAAEDTPLRLLIVDDNLEDAERIVTHLRNNGVAVRPHRAENIHLLREQLQSQTFDVALIATDTTSIAPQDAYAALQAAGRDIPMVALLPKLEQSLMLSCLQSGARNIGVRELPEHTRQVIRREFEDLRVRRGLRLLEASVRETERRCDMLIDSSREPIAYIHEGMHIRANAAYLEMFGYDEFEDIEGMSILDMVAPSHADAFKTLLKNLSKGEPPPESYTLQAMDGKGRTFPAVMQFSPATYEGEHCQQIVFHRQIVDAALTQEVEELRRTDIGTGLMNRPTFLRELETALSEAGTQAKTHGLLLLELDDIARLQREVGLGEMDALTTAVGARLRPALTDDDIVARFGENTLAILLRNATHSRTEDVAEMVVAAVRSRLLEVNHKSVSATASVGGVQISERINQLQSVLNKAAESIQSATGLGGNRYQVFDPGATDRAEEERRAAWIAHIREAANNDAGLQLHYQPIADLMGVDGPFFDTSLHLIGKDGNPVAPGLFVPIAEENGLSGPIDRWALSHAADAIAAAAAQGAMPRVLVKISQHLLDDDTLIDTLHGMLQARNVPPSHLVLQLAEPRVLAHLRAAQQMNERLIAIGGGFCVEQFGAGLNSLQLLTHFRPAFLKLDYDLILDIARNPDNMARVREIAEAAHAQDIRVIARGVNDANTMAALFSTGVDYVQGDFVGKMLPTMQLDG